MSTKLDSLTFNEFEINSRNQIVFGQDEENEFFVKIEIESNPNKTKNLDQEYDVIKKLNNSGCRSCPQVYELGSVSKEYVLQRLSGQAKVVVENSPHESFRYMVQDFISNSDSVRLADIVFSILEQKSLGIYQGDIKPANIRFNKENSICYLIDYDQSIELSEEQTNLDNIGFFNFCSQYDKEKFGIGNWLRHFSEYDNEDFLSLFDNGSFLLSETTIFNKQRTTNSQTGFYHTIDTPQLSINGSRGMGTRSVALDQAIFEDGERVLDVGCNAGLLSEYLHDRGCKVSGFDNDERITLAAKMVYNVLGKDINFFHLDLDEADNLEDYDTVMLFSVIHHTRNLQENCVKIANSCKRIFLESKLIEIGKQPYGDEWVQVGGWKVENVEQLIYLGQQLFPGFKLKNNFGQVDKHRYLLEFIKE